MAAKIIKTARITYLCLVMKKLFLSLTALFCALSFLTGCCCPCDPEAKTSHISYRYASAAEGRQLRLDNTNYFNALTQNDIDWKFRCTGKTLDDFKAYAASQIKDFTEEEKKAIDAMVSLVEVRLDALGICLQPDEIIFIKTDMADEGDAGGYTHKKEIYLSSFLVEALVYTMQGKDVYPPEYLEYINCVFPSILAHELFHCLTRNDARFRQQMYSLIRFTVMDHEVSFGPSVRNMLLQNPDVERFDNWAEFTINGQKRRCILIPVYECSYAEAAATDPNASFFNHMQCVLVPLDAPDTMIPVEQASDFYTVLGHNTDYVIAAEECLADNFGNLVAFGFNGYYSFENGGLQFITYQTPQLMHNICETVRNYYNAADPER